MVSPFSKRLDVLLRAAEASTEAVDYLCRTWTAASASCQRARRIPTSIREFRMPSGFDRRVVRASLTALALIVSGRVAEAQQAATCSYDTCALRLQHRSVLGVRVVQGASAVKADGNGIFSRRIPVFESRSDSVHYHYTEYRSHATRAGVLGILGMIALSAGETLYYQKAHDDRALMVSLISGGAIVGIVAGINRARSEDHVQRAIWLYNREFPR